MKNKTVPSTVISIDLQGGCSERFVLDRLKHALETQLDMRFPLTDLLMCEYYFQAGLDWQSQAIHSIYQNQPFVRSYYATFPPFCLHNLKKNIQNLAESGDADGKHILSYDFSAIESDKLSYYEEYGEYLLSNVHPLVFYDRLAKWIRHAFCYELKEQAKTLDTKVTVTNHHYSGELMRHLPELQWQAKSPICAMQAPNHDDLQQVIDHACAEYVLRETEQTFASFQAFENWYSTTYTPLKKKLQQTVQWTDWESAQRNVLQYVAEQAPQSRLHADLLVELAEWYLFNRMSEQAHSLYVQALPIYQSVHPHQTKLQNEIRWKIILSTQHVNDNLKNVDHFLTIAATNSKQPSEWMTHSSYFKKIIGLLHAHTPNYPSWINNLIKGFINQTKDLANAQFLLEWFTEMQSSAESNGLLVYKIASNLARQMRDFHHQNYSFASNKLLFDTYLENNQNRIVERIDQLFQHENSHWVHLLPTPDRYKSGFFNFFDEKFILHKLLTEALDTCDVKNGILSVPYAELSADISERINFWMPQTEHQQIFEKMDWAISHIFGEHHPRRLAIVLLLIDIYRRLNANNNPFRRASKSNVYNHVDYVDHLNIAKTIIEVNQMTDRKAKNFLESNRSNFQRKVAEAHDRFGREVEAIELLINEHEEQLAKRSETTFETFDSLLDLYKKNSRFDEAFSMITKTYDVVVQTYTVESKQYVQMLRKIVSYMGSLPENQYFEEEYRKYSHFFHAVIGTQLLAQIREKWEFNWDLTVNVLEELVESDDEADIVLVRELIMEIFKLAYFYSTLESDKNRTETYRFNTYLSRKLAAKFADRKDWTCLSHLCSFLFRSQKSKFTDDSDIDDWHEFLQWLQLILQNIDADTYEFKQARIILRECLQLQGPKHPVTIEVRKKLAI